MTEFDGIFRLCFELIHKPNCLAVANEIQELLERHFARSYLSPLSTDEIIKAWDAGNYYSVEKELERNYRHQLELFMADFKDYSVVKICNGLLKSWIQKIELSGIKSIVTDVFKIYLDKSTNDIVEYEAGELKGILKILREGGQ